MDKDFEIRRDNVVQRSKARIAKIMLQIEEEEAQGNTIELPPGLDICVPKFLKRKGSAKTIRPQNDGVMTTDQATEVVSKSTILDDIPAEILDAVQQTSATEDSENKEARKSSFNFKELAKTIKEVIKLQPDEAE